MLRRLKAGTVCRLVDQDVPSISEQASDARVVDPRRLLASVAKPVQHVEESGVASSGLDATGNEDAAHAHTEFGLDEHQRLGNDHRADDLDSPLRHCTSTCQ